MFEEFILPRRESLSAPFPVAVKRVPGVESRGCVQPVERGEGHAAAFYLTHERLLTGVNADVDL